MNTRLRKAWSAPVHARCRADFLQFTRSRRRIELFADAFKVTFHLSADSVEAGVEDRRDTLVLDYGNYYILSPREERLPACGKDHTGHADRGAADQ